MAVYIADRHLPGLTLEQLAAIQKAAIETSRRFTASGRPVRFIRTAWVPGDGHVMCLFEAENPQSVRDVNEAAGIPFTRIVEAMELTP
jgi:Nickel responsive protein SCO4226-like